MRTTVTLDRDTERLVREAMRRRGVSFKQALNEAVRDGLSSQRGRKRAFVQRTFAMGAEPLFRWEKALSLAEAMEDEEIVRKQSLRK